jgi:outer membrane receptor protein involved in Fe transport
MNRRPHAFRASNLSVLTLAIATLFPVTSFALSTHDANKPHHGASLRGASASSVAPSRMVVGMAQTTDAAYRMADPASKELGLSVGYKATDSDEGWTLSLDAKSRRDANTTNSDRDLGVTVNARLNF